jgi:hypothetical protein
MIRSDEDASRMSLQQLKNSFEFLDDEKSGIVTFAQIYKNVLPFFKERLMVLWPRPNEPVPLIEE